jgi:hypothetical protein
MRLAKEASLRLVNHVTNTDRILGWDFGASLTQINADTSASADIIIASIHCTELQGCPIQRPNSQQNAMSNK